MTMYRWSPQGHLDTNVHMKNVSQFRPQTAMHYISSATKHLDQGMTLFDFRVIHRK